MAHCLPTVRLGEPITDTEEVMENAYTLLHMRRGKAVPFHFSASSVSMGLNKLFGCWHREMSLPVTIDGRTYRTCMNCGLHRDFDLNRWKTYGPYYRD